MRHLLQPDVDQSRYITFYPTPSQRQQIPLAGSTVYTAAVPEALRAHMLEMKALTAVSQLSSMQKKTI